jgi:tetratricopeptide (TPR) repeat protein
MDRQAAASLFEQGRAALAEKDRRHARELFDDALNAWTPVDPEPLRAAIHVEIGRVARDLGDNERAVSNYRTAAELYRSLNDEMNLAHALRHVADILRGMGRTAEAEPFIQEAMTIYRALQPLPQLHLANSLRVAALLREEAGKPDEALPLWVEARDLYRAVGVEAGVAESRARLAV